MGLDNIPYHYPCRTNGTAIMNPRLDVNGDPLLDEDGQPMEAIDCQATQKAGGCQWKNEYEKVAPELGQPVYGMLGTDCWYRGKWGQYLIEDAGIANGIDDGDISFYGDNDDGTVKSSSSCDVLANAIDDFLNNEPDWKMSDGDGNALDLAYASWYLKWASRHAGGLNCWY